MPVWLHDAVFVSVLAIFLALVVYLIFLAGMALVDLVDKRRRPYNVTPEEMEKARNDIMETIRASEESKAKEKLTQE